MLREYRPKVVTTATSVWRTWKVKSMQPKITSNTAAVNNVIGFRFIGPDSRSFVGRGFVRVRRQDGAAQQQVLPDFFLQVQDQNILRVRRRENIFAHGLEGTRQRLQMRALDVNRGRGRIRHHLVCESRGFSLRE